MKTVKVKLNTNSCLCYFTYNRLENMSAPYTGSKDNTHSSYLSVIFVVLIGQFLLRTKNE